MGADLRIQDVRAYPTSFPVPPGQSVTLGIGRAVKRDAVVVQVATEGGLVGWGESHHGRAPGAVAHLVNTTLRQLVLGMDAADVTGIWARVYKMQEPFPAHDHRSYALAAGFARVPLAAGEKHYTRFEFTRVIEDRAITILQPDLSKTGGITEALRIAALASAWKLPIHPHTSMTGLNMAATIHFLAAIENAGHFEADVSKGNLFREALTSPPYELGSDGCVRPLEAPGIGVEVDEAFLAAHPVIEGPGYV